MGGNTGHNDHSRPISIDYPNILVHRDLHLLLCSGTRWSLLPICPSWVCDDEESDDCAQICRKKAINLIQKAKEGDQDITADQVGAEEALMVDLLRRSGQFDAASNTCKDGLSKNPEKIIEDILQLQSRLIQQKNVDSYTIEDATGGHK